MAFFNDFKEKFNKAAQSVTNMTKDSVEISRLGSESRGIANELASLYEQIGRLYVDSRGTEAEGLSALCARVDELLRPHGGARTPEDAAQEPESLSGLRRGDAQERALLLQLRAAHA